jgi:hypothetical protein
MRNQSMTLAVCVSAAAAALASFVAGCSALRMPAGARSTGRVRRIGGASSFRISFCVVDQRGGAPRGAALTIQSSRESRPWDLAR